MNRMKIKALVMAVFVSLFFTACGGQDATPGATATDYSQAKHWLSIPVVSHNVDVFFLYPTAWQKVHDSDPNICNIDNPSMLAGSASAFGRQATAFETFANIYAPYYRQADGAYIIALPLTERHAFVAGIPTLDAVAAFEYYIKHFNNGRPFILASHSQGSIVMINLLAGYMKDHPDIYARMIAAYLIGYPVTARIIEDNPHLKFAEGPDDTGVIISYNTQAPDVLPGVNPILSGAVGLVINPITWTRTETVATTTEGLGSIMPNPVTGAFEPVPQYADARVDIESGVLLCTTADEDGLYALTRHVFPRGVYHSFEYPFYYFNIRANALNRANKYLEQGQKGRPLSNDF